MTITEALAEIKTVLKRIQTKQEYVKTYMIRLDSLKDPLEKEGGAEKMVKETMQSIEDLEQRLVDIRSVINDANVKTTITIEGVERSIADWITWRREVATGRKMFVRNLRLKLEDARTQIRYGIKNTQGELIKADMIVNVDEAALNKEAEAIENILGQLDGQLSLKNATVMVDI